MTSFRYVIYVACVAFVALEGNPALDFIDDADVLAANGLTVFRRRLHEDPLVYCRVCRQILWRFANVYLTLNS